jgi:hypothetical protein
MRQTVVIVVLTIGAMSLPRMVARRWATSDREGTARQLIGGTFIDAFGR